MSTSSWKQIDGPIWYRIAESLEMKSLLKLSKTNKFFFRLLRRLLEEHYKEICFRCHICRLPDETWKEAFSKIPERAITYSSFNQPEYLQVLFCPFEVSSRFALLSENHVIVSSFDGAQHFYRYFPIKYDYTDDDQVCLLSGGKLLTVWHYKRRLLHVYDVDTQERIFEKRFGPFSYQCFGSVMDENRLFNVITRKVIKFPHSDEYHLHYCCYDQDNQYFTVSAKLTFYVCNVNTHSLKKIIKINRAHCTIHMMLTKTLFFNDETTTTYHHFPSGETVTTDLDGMYGMSGFVKFTKYSLLLEPVEARDCQYSLLIFNEKTGEWKRRSSVLKGIDLMPISTFLQYHWDDIRKVKVREKDKDVYKCVYFHCSDGEVMYKVFDDKIKQDMRTEESYFFVELEEKIRKEWMKKQPTTDALEVL